jgi:hypothetical protein
VRVEPAAGGIGRRVVSVRVADLLVVVPQGLAAVVAQAAADEMAQAAADEMAQALAAVVTPVARVLEVVLESAVGPGAGAEPAAVAPGAAAASGEQAVPATARDAMATGDLPGGNLEQVRRPGVVPASSRDTVSAGSRWRAARRYASCSSPAGAVSARYGSPTPRRCSG